MSDFIGQVISGRYEIRERIGAGGMARVFKAWDCNLERMVAVKLLHEHLGDDPSFKGRFEREAKLVASLNHPNIVQIYDYSSFERDGFPVYYMVMAYLPGETLRHLIESHNRQNQRMPREQIVAVVQALCQALDYAHARGMVHRDVKPGNVIMDENGRAVLTDFGIARMVQSARLTQDSLTTGTPAYMSPEQISGEAGDARSDVYSLGVIFFEMLTGKPPYSDDGGLSIILKHLQSPIPTISERLGRPEPELDAVIQRALAKQAEQRYQTALAFSAGLESALRATDGDAVLLDTASFAGTTGREQVRKPTGVRKDDKRLSRLAFITLALIISILAVLILARGSGGDIGIDSTEQPSILAMSPQTAPSLDSFTTDFEPGEPELAVWPGSDPGTINREFLPDGTYRLTALQPGGALTTLINSPTAYTNVSLAMTAQLSADSSVEAGYGIVFRYQDSDNYNVFAVDGRGQFSIWVRERGEWRELRNATPRWTESEFLRTDGEANKLRVNISDTNLVAFINFHPVARVDDATFLSGKAGIYLAAPEDGAAVLIVDSFEVYPIIPAMLER